MTNKILLKLHINLPLEMNLDSFFLALSSPFVKLLGKCVEAHVLFPGLSRATKQRPEKNE